MADVTNRQLNIYITSGDAEAALDRLKKKEKELTDQLDKATNPKQVQRLTTEIGKLNEQITRQAKKVSGELVPSYRDLERATTKYLNEFKKTNDPAALANFEKFNKLLAERKDQINKLSDANQSLTKKGIFSAAFWGNLAANGVARFTSSIGGFFRSAIDEALNADEATQRLQATLSNLGDTDAFGRITRKAQEMADKFKFLDNDDVVGVFNKLIDYGKLTEKQMNDLLPVIIDFSAKQKISLEEAGDAIVKALSGNAKALKGYGIDIKDAGTETERLNVIMTTLKDKVDGSAEAFSQTAKGSIAIAKQQFADLKEEVGNNLIPVLTKLLSLANSLLEPLKFLLNGGRGSQLAELKKNEDVQKGATVEERLLNKQLDDFIEQGKKKNISVKAITDEFLATLKKRKDGIDRTLNSDAIKAMYSNPGAQREERFRIASDNTSMSIAIQRFIDSKNVGTTKPLGIPGFGGGGSGTKDKLDKEQKAYEEFFKKLKELNADFDASQLEGFGKELALLQKKRDALYEEAETHKDVAKSKLLIDELYRKESLALIDKYGLIDAKKLKDGSEAAAKQTFQIFSNLAEALQKLADRLNRNNLAGKQLAVIKANGKARLQAELELLEEQKKQELLNKDLTENEKALIEERYRQARDDKEKEASEARVSQYIDFISRTAAILDNFSQAKTNKENAELERDRVINDKKRQNLDRLLRNKLISQQAYDRAISNIEAQQDQREREFRKKQFIRNRNASIVSAVINGAQGATATIRELGFPAAIPFLILEGLAILSQIALINSQKPQFGRGKGPLTGLSHRDGGNAIIDGVTGQKIAEIEVGEAITNKHTMADQNSYNVSGTPSQIISKLNSMHGGVSWATGASLQPAWVNSIPARMNYKAANSALQKMYASGGTFAGGSASSDNGMMMDAINTMNNVNLQLISILSKGIKANVLLSDNEDAQARKAAIIQDATLK